MEKIIVYRQGEVLIKKIEKKNFGEMTSYGAPMFKQRKNRVIVEGEQTGHMHAVNNGVLWESTETWKNELYLSADTDTELSHDEHATIKLPAGDYQITFQREYDEINRHRRVID